MGNINYYQWLNGCGCQGGLRRITGSGACDCDQILLELSNLHTDYLTLQDEIDELSGEVESKLDASAYTPADLTDYYTKEEVDELIPGVPSLSGYATEEWVEDKHYLTEHQPLTGYATTSTLIQYITNLQQQIDSLISSISGCCGSSGETQYRWVTMTGENDYWCSGTTKMAIEKQQSSTDGINWTDTGSERSGSTVLEENCSACGYMGGSEMLAQYSSTTQSTTIASICSSDIEKISIAYAPNPLVYSGCLTTIQTALSGNTVFTYRTTTTIGDGEYANITDMRTAALSSEVTAVGNGAFSGCTNLVTVSFGNYSRLDTYNQDPDGQLTAIGDYAFYGCSSLDNLQLVRNKTTVPTLGVGALDGCTSLQTIYVRADMESAFKAAWPAFADKIVGIN